MERDILTNSGMDIHLVRYFDYDGEKYLIYTIDGENEKDNQGHIFVHISKIDNLVATAVEGENYETVKNIIKDVVAKNRNNIPLSITDLNYNELNGLNIVSNKQLGLLPNYVEILKQNQPDFPDSSQSDQTTGLYEQSNLFNTEQLQTNMVEINGPQEAFNPFDLNTNQPNLNEVSNVDYEKMYLQQVELVNKLNLELETYKNKIDTIKNIINN